MSEANSRVKAGLFVSAGLALLLISILMFGGDRAFLRSYSHYKVTFPSTQGLAKGSVVSLSGMEVGNVADISFDSEARLLAILNIDKKFASLITTTSSASIRTQGALGDKYIYITPGQTAGETLKENDRLISETQPDIFDLIAGKGSDISIAVDVLKELNLLLHNLNSEGKSASLMENLVGASQNVSKLMNEPSLRESLTHLRNILKKVDAGDGTLGMLINDPTLHEKLVGLMGATPRNSYLKPLLREVIKQNEKPR